MNTVAVLLHAPYSTTRAAAIVVAAILAGIICEARNGSLIEQQTQKSDVNRDLEWCRCFYAFIFYY